MKLRSIALAGLLGAGFLMTSGCKEDDIIPRVASVNVVNATVGDLSVTVDSSTKTVHSQGEFVPFPIVSTDDSINVSFNGGSTTSVANDAIHVVGINTACNGEYVKDTLDANKLRVMNLSATTEVKITDVNITFNGVQVDIPNKIGICSVVSTHSGSINGTWTLQINGGTVDTVNINNDLVSGVELIIYDVTSQKGTAIPLASI